MEKCCWMWGRACAARGAGGCDVLFHFPLIPWDIKIIVHGANIHGKVLRSFTSIHDIDFQVYLYFTRQHSSLAVASKEKHSSALLCCRLNDSWSTLTSAVFASLIFLLNHAHSPLQRSRSMRSRQGSLKAACCWFLQCKNAISHQCHFFKVEFNNYWVHICGHTNPFFPLCGGNNGWYVIYSFRGVFLCPVKLRLYIAWRGGNVPKPNCVVQLFPTRQRARRSVHPDSDASDKGPAKRWISGLKGPLPQQGPQLGAGRRPSF